jgi:hypothetical protein
VPTRRGPHLPCDVGVKAGCQYVGLGRRGAGQSPLVAQNSRRHLKLHQSRSIHRKSLNRKSGGCCVRLHQVSELYLSRQSWTEVWPSLLLPADRTTPSDRRPRLCSEPAATAITLNQDDTLH